MLDILDHIGIFVFAISGLLTAADKNLDFFGGVIIAFITALGGGTLRDLLLNTDIGWMSSSSLILTVFGGILVGILFRTKLKAMRRTFFIFDTLGIAVFTIVGVEKSLEHNELPLVALFLGMVSATFGGVIRDVLCNEIPLIFRKEVYATACIAGSGAYLLGVLFGYGGETWLLILSIVVIISIRTFAVIFKWRMPLIKDISR